MKPKILIINPNRRQAEELGALLRPRFDVLVGNDPELSIALFSRLRPWAVVASLQQHGMTGWHLTAALSRIGASQSTVVIVHGDPDSGVPSAFAEPGAEAPAHVDYFVPADELDFSWIANILTQRAAGMLSEGSRPAPAWIPPVGDPVPQSPPKGRRLPSLFEILTTAVSVENFRSLFADR